MVEWTRQRVEERIVEAFDVLKRLPAERVPGYFNTWPEIRLEFSDMVGRAADPMRRPPPSPDAISRMEETITWGRFLEADDAKLLWARAKGTPWKEICWRFGIARSTAHRRWEHALSIIAWRLNGRRRPKRSRAFVIDRVRQASR